MTSSGFLPEPASTDGGRHLFDEDIKEVGYVMNASRAWAYQPEIHDGLFELMRQATSSRPFTLRERGILVAACAGARGDSYCSLAWGARLAGWTDPELAAGVIRGDDGTLSESERALAAWARSVARDPNSTRAADVEALRQAGYTDADIFALTVFLGLRIAFSTVNDALGLRPDAQMRESTPAAVLDAVTFGRPIDE